MNEAPLIALIVKRTVTLNSNRQFNRKQWTPQPLTTSKQRTHRKDRPFNSKMAKYSKAGRKTAKNTTERNSSAAREEQLRKNGQKVLGD